MGYGSWSVFYGYWKSPGLDPAVSRGINRQEVSGPIITVYTCDDVAAVIQQASRLPPEVKVGDLLRITIDAMEVMVWVIAEEPGSWRVSTQHPHCGKNIELHIEVVSRVAS